MKQYHFFVINMKIFQISRANSQHKYLNTKRTSSPHDWMLNNLLKLEDIIQYSRK